MNFRASMGFDPREWPNIIDWWLFRDGTRIAYLGWWLPRGLNGHLPENPGTKELRVWETATGRSLGNRIWRSY